MALEVNTGLGLIPLCGSELLASPSWMIKGGRLLEGLEGPEGPEGHCASCCPLCHALMPELSAAEPLGVRLSEK